MLKKNITLQENKSEKKLKPHKQTISKLKVVVCMIHSKVGPFKNI